MATFEIHNENTAVPEAADTLASTKAKWQFIPNLHGILAESPLALNTYNELFSLFSTSSFSPAQQQLIYLAINYVNRCEYCMSGHTALAKGAGLSEQAIEAIREDQEIEDQSLQALRKFTQSLVEKAGRVEPTEVDAFIAAGFTKAQVLELLVALATKLISNYTNHIAHTPLDPFMADTKWVAPENR